MSNRGGIYEGPDGELLHGDGREVESPTSPASSPEGARSDMLDFIRENATACYTVYMCAVCGKSKPNPYVIFAQGYGCECEPPTNGMDPETAPAKPLTMSAEALTWICRFHPADWWHEVGCPHVEWTKEQLQAAIESQKREQPKIAQRWMEDLQKEAAVHAETRERLESTSIVLDAVTEANAGLIISLGDARERLEQARKALQSIAFHVPCVAYEQSDKRYIDIEDVFHLKRIGADAVEAIDAARGADSGLGSVKAEGEQS